jgi:hypothetical protein
MADRYKAVVSNVTATAHMAAHPSGEYVHAAEYEALRAAVEAYEADAVAYRAEVERLRGIEIKARVWSAYQDDDSVRDQETDPALRQMAEDATLALMEAVMDCTSPSPEPVRREMLDDGFGNQWELCGEHCRMQIVRPGKVQCDCTEFKSGPAQP